MGTTRVMPPVLPLNHIKCRVHKTYQLTSIEDYKPQTMSHTAKEERKKGLALLESHERKNDKSYLEKEKERKSTVLNNNIVTNL